MLQNITNLVTKLLQKSKTEKYAVFLSFSSRFLPILAYFATFAENFKPMAAQSNKLCIAFADTDLLRRYDELFETRNAERNIRVLVDNYENKLSFEEDMKKLEAQKESLVQRLDNSKECYDIAVNRVNTLQEEFEKLQSSYNSLQEEYKVLSESSQADAELAQKLADATQKCAELELQLAEQAQSASAAEDREHTLVIEIPAVTMALLRETARRLSEKYGKEFKPGDILLDMFFRYTVERWNEWFYPFVLKDKDIEETTGTTIKVLKEYIRR